MPISTRVVYSPKYNIGFPGIDRLHPFDTRKFGRAFRALKRKAGRDFTRRVHRVKHAASIDTLRLVHTDAYLRSLRNPLVLAHALEVPLLTRIPWWLTDHAVLRPMRWATAGTVFASSLALQHGLAINLGGGFHHAKPDRGERFCIYADVAVAIASLRRSGAVDPDALIVHIDCDAHQGNGLCHCFANDSRIFLYDLYNGSIYPAADSVAKRRLDHPVPLPLGASDKRYLNDLRSTLPKFLMGVARIGRIAIAYYNAGTDIVRGDPIGCLCISPEAVLERDRFVLDSLAEMHIPTVMLPSGGYTRASYQLIADTAAYAIENW